MKFKFLIVLPLLLTSCNNNNNILNKNSTSFYPNDENDYLTILNKLNDKLDSLNDNDEREIAKIETEFMFLFLDVPFSYSNNGNIINYGAINLNRSSYNNTLKDEKQKDLAFKFINNVKFRKALAFSFDRENIIKENRLDVFTYSLNDRIGDKFLYIPSLAYDLLLEVKNDFDVSIDEVIHLDTITTNTNLSFANAFKESVERSFKNEIVIDIHTLDNKDYYLASEETFDYDINLNISFESVSNTNKSFIKPLMNELLKYNGIKR